MAFNPKPDVRETTDTELNAILVPMGNRVCDFKDATSISWVHIIPAVQNVSVRLLVQARGLEEARRLYILVRQLDAQGGSPVAAHLGHDRSDAPPEKMAELSAMLWQMANHYIGKGCPIEHVAQAFGAFVVKTSEAVTHGDTWLLKIVFADTIKRLATDEYDT